MSHSRDEIIVPSTRPPAGLLTPAARRITAFYANAVMRKSQMNYSWFSDLIKINAWLHKVLDGRGDCIYYANKAETRSCGVARWRGGEQIFHDPWWETARVRTRVLKVIKGHIYSIMLLFYCLICMSGQSQFRTAGWKLTSYEDSELLKERKKIADAKSANR